MFTIQKTAVASGFSPRFASVLAEGWAFASRFESTLSTLHVTERSAEGEALLHEAFKQLGIPSDTESEWLSGDPVGALVKAAGRKKVDLLVAGALIKEVEVSGRHFLGNVARGLLKYSPCSLLLITQPTVQPRKFKKIVMVTDFSPGARTAFRAALRLAEIDSAECLHVIAVQSPFSAAIEGRESMSKARGEQLLDEFAAAAERSEVQVETRLIESNTGLGAADFTQAVGADILVVPTVGDGGSSLLPAYMDWIHQAVPCDLWLVKKALHRVNAQLS